MNSDSNFYDPNNQIPNPYEPVLPGPLSPTPPGNPSPPEAQPPLSIPPGNQPMGPNPPYPPVNQSSPSHPLYPYPPVNQPVGPSPSVNQYMQGQGTDTYHLYPPIPQPPAPPQGYPPSPSMPMYNAGTLPTRRTSTRIGVIVLVVVFLLIVSTIAIAIPVHNNQVASANATATAVNATATAVRQAHTAATAQASATAVASTYPFSANLKLNDPLADNSHGYGWEITTLCKFTGGAYHNLDDQDNTFSLCTAIQTNFLNFTYQVSIQLVKGDLAGITFRGDSLTDHFYEFSVGSGGFYVLSVHTHDGAPTIITEGVVPQFDTSKANTIGVVARNNTFDLYVNQQQITTQIEPTYTSGQIGTIAHSHTEARYTNAQVWVL